MVFLDTIAPRRTALDVSLAFLLAVLQAVCVDNPAMTHAYIHTLRRRAARAGLSVRRWCFLAGIHQSTYYRWLSNRSGPTLASLVKLETAIPAPPED